MKMHRNLSIGGIGLAAGLGCAAFTLGAKEVTAATLLFDRGLPTANLNIAAGDNRSNVAWADNENSSTPSQYWLPGDDFTLSTNADVTDIRVWTLGNPTNSQQGSTGLSLLGGNDGGTIGVISNSFTANSVTYINNVTYQGSSGGYVPLYQVDFSVNLNLAAGQKYDFFVNGPWYLDSTINQYVNTFLHASNAALSGSTQQGADGATLWLPVDNGVNGTVETWYSGDIGGNTGTTGWGAGWDKNSDANVQVFGTPLPIPGSGFLAAVGGLALIGGLTLRRRMAKVH